MTCFLGMAPPAGPSGVTRNVETSDKPAEASRPPLVTISQREACARIRTVARARPVARDGHAADRLEHPLEVLQVLDAQREVDRRGVIVERLGLGIADIRVAPGQ